MIIFSGYTDSLFDCICPHGNKIETKSVAVAKKTDHTAYDVRYSCRTEPPKISRPK